MNLSEKKLQELKDKKISIEDLYKKYFYTQKDGINIGIILKLLNSNICSFKEIVDRFKSMKDDWNHLCLMYLLENEELFEELIENKKLNKGDLRYLLNTIDNEGDLGSLCENTSLIKYLLNEFVLNKEDVDKFYTILENYWWCKDHNIHTVFEMIEYRNKNNEEILKLNELNRKVYLLKSFELSLDQKLELTEILKDNEQAQNTLVQIVENHLEDQYDFESLKNLLKKDSEKKKIKLNF